MIRRIEIGPHGNPDHVLIESDIYDVSPVLAHTGLSDFDATVQWDPSLRNHEFKRVRIYENDELRFRGELADFSGDKKADTLTISGDGIEQVLANFGVEKQISSKPAWKVLRDLLQNDADLDKVQVDKPDVSEIKTDALVYNLDTESEFRREYSPPATAPVEITSNGVLRLLDASFLIEGENYGGYVQGTTTHTDASGGSLAVTSTSVHDPEYSFTTEYDIPGDQFKVAARWWVPSYDFSEDAWGFVGADIELDGNVIQQFGSGAIWNYNGSRSDYQHARTFAVASDGGTMTTEDSAARNETVDDVTLFPSDPAAGDAYYFGEQFPFDGVHVDLSQVGDGTWDIAWEYYDGGGWSAIPNVDDRSNGFTQQNSVEWALTDVGNWTTTNVNGQDGYWVRARITSVSGVTTRPLGKLVDVATGPMMWYTFAGTPSNTVQAGGHTIRFNCTGTDDYYTMPDVFVAFDDRYSFTFPSSTDANQALPGPEPKPDQHTIKFTQETVPFNVVGINVDAQIDNVTGPQKIQASFDGGVTWLPGDGSEQNTRSIAVDNQDNIGSHLDVRVTLGRHGSQSQTPTQGVQSQEISAFEVRYDGTSLSIIEDQVFQGSGMEVMQKIAQKSDYNVVFDHTATDAYGNPILSVHAFEDGTVQRSADFTIANRRPRRSGRTYHNHITVRGKERADGTRPFVTVEDTEEVGKRGVQHYDAKKPSLTSFEDLRSEARSLLAKKVGRSNGGKLEIEPTKVQPGYDYPVDWWDDGAVEYDSVKRVEYGQAPGEDNAMVVFSDEQDVTASIVEQGFAIADTKSSI